MVLHTILYGAQLSSRGSLIRSRERQRCARSSPADACRWVYIALMVAAFVANTVFDVNVVVVILAAAVFGVVLALVQWKKGGAK